MIKLIATDMDGTLLNEHGKLPEDFFETIEKLKAKNVKFAVASGRPYVTLYENFKPYSDDIYYICDNGAYVVGHDGQPEISVINKDVVNKIIDASAGMENVELILCGKKFMYHRKCCAEIQKEIDKYYINKKIVSDLKDIDDDIFKIAVCDLNGSSEHSYKILEPLFGSDFKVVVSGTIWVDIMNKNINKGDALKQLQKEDNITFEETMVFGDFYNDVDMLKEGYYSFVMENANDDMKQYGRFIADSNKNNGVIKAINEYVL